MFIKTKKKTQQRKSATATKGQAVKKMKKKTQVKETDTQSHRMQITRGIDSFCTRTLCLYQYPRAQYNQST